jgi:hypothetical protein
MMSRLMACAGTCPSITYPPASAVWHDARLWNTQARLDLLHGGGVGYRHDEAVPPQVFGPTGAAAAIWILPDLDSDGRLCVRAKGQAHHRGG